MEKKYIIYISIMIVVILFVYLVTLPPILRLLEYSKLDMLYSTIILIAIIPAMTILLLVATLGYAKSLLSEREKEKVKEIITPKLSEKEEFEETLFENERLRVLQIIRTLSTIKGNQIPFSAIQKKTNFDINKIEDMILLLMADELLDGEIVHPNEEKEGVIEPILVLPEKKVIKVKYIKDSKNDKEEDEGEKNRSKSI